MGRIKQRVYALFRTESLKKYFAVSCIIIILAMLCELFIFNYKWIESISDKGLKAKPKIVGAFKNEDGSYTMDDENGNILIIYSNLGAELKYLCFNPGGDDDGMARITVTAADEANKNGISAPSRMIYSDEKRSQYVRLHFSGEIKELKIQVTELGLKKFLAEDVVQLNVHVPLMFSFVRVMVISLAVIVLFVFRPKSFIYQYKTDLRSWKQKSIVCLAILAYSAICFVIISWNKDDLDTYGGYDAQHEYQRLADAFIDGHLYLEDDLPAELVNMDNPYDTNERKLKCIEFKLDYAYYDGKYYCYFGALPAVLLYMPYKLLTGIDLPNFVAVMVFGITFMVGSAMLLWEIIKKWHHDIPFALYMITYSAFVLISGLIHVVGRAQMYVVPNISALAFATIGLAEWLSASNDAPATGKLNPQKLAIGAFCLSLTAGCRPQFLVSLFVGAAFLWEDIVKSRILFSKKTAKETAAACFPIIAVAAAVMWYNYARFGSVFDFGANYNLTSNDMTKRGFVFDRNLLGLFTYIIQPPTVTAIFPFIQESWVQTSYMGLTISEGIYGGILQLYPALWIGIYGAAKKSAMQCRQERNAARLSIALTAVVVIVDTQMAGILQRYCIDFTWLVALPTAMSIFSLYEKASDISARAKENVVQIISAIVAVTFCISFFALLSQMKVSMERVNIGVYNKMKYIIAFWL